LPTPTKWLNAENHRAGRLAPALDGSSADIPLDRNRISVRAPSPAACSTHHADGGCHLELNILLIEYPVKKDKHTKYRPFIKLLLIELSGNKNKYDKHDKI